MTTLTTKKLNGLIADGDLTGEIKRLHTAIERIGAGNHELLIQIADTLERAEKAEADNAALRQDALRYRFLRNDECDTIGVESDKGTGNWEFIAGSDLDAAIDAAMREGKR